MIFGSTARTPIRRAAQMSGSGASRFGIFDDIDTASAVAAAFEKDGVWAKATKLHPFDVLTNGVIS